MAGTRDRGRYGHTSGLDLDRLRAELSTSDGGGGERDEGLSPDRYLSKGGDPNLSKGTRRLIRRTEARRAARGD